MGWVRGHRLNFLLRFSAGLHDLYGCCGMLAEREFTFSEVCPDGHIVLEMWQRSRESTSPG